MIEYDCPLSVCRQCQLLEVNRNRLAPPPPKLTEEDAALCRLIDEIHLEGPAFGARKIRNVLRRHHGINAGRSRVVRLMRHMGVTAIYRRPRTSLPGKGEEHRIYPYLLGNGVDGPDEAWCADITYLPVGRCFGASPSRFGQEIRKTIG
jgi:putative transposase